MKQSFGRFISLFGCMVTATCLALPQWAAAEEKAQPAILVQAEYAEEGRPWQKEMEKNGYRVKVLKNASDLEWELLKDFNVLMVTAFRYDQTGKLAGQGCVTKEALEKWSGLLRRFVDAGGGILVLNGIDAESREAHHALLDRFDVRFLFEQVFDKAHSYSQPSRLMHTYSWTTNVEKHDVTQNVKTIFYPTMYFMYGPMTCPAQVSSNGWQVVVRGMDTAASYQPTWPMSHSPIFKEESPGIFASAPPLVAVKDTGKGRVAAVGMSYLPCVLWRGHPAAEDICVSRGDGTTPSDTGILLANLCRWLAAPSLASRGVGGWKGATGAVAESSTEMGSASKIDWTDISIGETVNSYPGMIGARTRFSDGSGTIPQWVQAAKAAGLRWIAFTETFEKLSKEKWDLLVKECEKETDDDLWVIPGIEVMDVGNNHWVQFAPSLPWLTPNLLGPDGKRVREAQNFLFARQQPPTAPICVKKNGHPAFSYRFLNAFAVYTAEKGTIIDQSLDDYLVKQDQEDEVQPIVVHRMYDPREIERARKTVPLTYLNALDAATARHWFTEPSWRPGRSYISSGPRLLCWQGFNRERGTLGDYYTAGTERWRVRLKVSAEAGLKEVKIYDGTKLYARYLPEGKEFDVNLDGLHDQSRRLLAVVTDQNGGQLITPCLLTVDFLGRTQVCSDRNNTMPIGIVKGENGKPSWYHVGTMVDKGRWPSIVVYPPVDSYFMGLPGMDGGFEGGQLYPGLFPAIPDWKRGAGYFSKCSYPQVGKHVVTQRWEISNEFLPIEGHLRAILNVTPYLLYRALEQFKLDVDERALVRRDQDISLVLLEGTLTALKPFAFDDKDPVSLEIGVFNPTPKQGECNHFAFVRPGQPMESGPLPDSEKAFRYDGPVPATSYFVCYPALTGAQGIMVLDDGYSIHADADKKRVWVQTYLSKPGQKMAKGDKLPFRLLFVLGRYAGPPDSSEFEWVQKSMGITGAPAYGAELTQGKVAGTKLFLDLQAQDGGCLGKIQKKTKERFPCRLPVRVHGLNPNWSAAVYDRQRKELVPFGLMDDVGYASLDLDQGEADVYIGNLATSDRPELKLWVVEEGGKKLKVTAQNSTDKEVKTTVRIPEGYNRVTMAPKEVTVPAGGQIEFMVK